VPEPPEAPPELQHLRPKWLTAFDPNDYALTRFVFLRFLGLIYTVAFLVAVNQLVPLVGTDGLEPADRYLDAVSDHFGGADAFFRLPTLFWFGISDDALRLVSVAGLVLSLCVLFGLANAVVMFLLWLFYLSIVQVGQVFWGYGWESLLLETGFLAIFLVPPLDPRPFSKRGSPPKLVVWLLRWVLFRLMLGAGLIKLRGDECWRDLTCLVTHYETQPLPNPMSWVLHQVPVWVQKGSVLFNHYAELIAPLMIFGPRRLRIAGGLSIVAFQLLLIVSGNLSWLNWLSITIAIACFDDAALLRLCPARFRERLRELSAGAPLSKPRKVAAYALACVVALLSLNPVINLFSPTQRMNSSFDPLYLVNTYGAFGSIGRERYEIVIEGTTDDDPASATWSPYEFRCKPGDVARRPCVVAPYQYRID
jgi:Lipase maturation factor